MWFYRLAAPTTTGRKDKMMRVALIAMLTVIAVAGCAPKTDLERLQHADDQNNQLVSGDAVVYVSVPEDGRYGDTVYDGSGETTAQMLTGGFASHVRRAEKGLEYERKESAIESAEATDADYLVYPKISHWEDRATEWSGIPTKATVIVSLYRVSDGELVDKTRISGSSPTLPDPAPSSPQDMIRGGVQEYINSVTQG